MAIETRSLERVSVRKIAALGLAAWFHNCNRAAVEKVLGLGSHELALFGQTVGYEEA